MSADRFILNLSPSKSVEETALRTQQELIRLVQQINQAKIPIVVGPLENLPEGVQTGQPIIDWRSGTSIYKVWNGSAFI